MMGVSATILIGVEDSGAGFGESKSSILSSLALSVSNCFLYWSYWLFLSPPGYCLCMTIADPEGNILQFFGGK